MNGKTSEAEQAALTRRMLQLAREAGNIPAEPTDETEWADWVNNADAPTRMAHPKHYWSVTPEGELTQFFWDEMTVSREEYVEASGESQ
jgi:hypothetical protein